MMDAYSAAGVNIDAANETVERYRSFLERHVDARVLQGVGGFSGCFALEGFRQPVLVASTDGVGTKVLVAAALGRFDTIGADLVHHCINDVLCSNGQPLFFLDYLAMGKLEPTIATHIVGGVAQACANNNVALLGGETAEMPGVYTPPHFDLAGTIVGSVERDKLLDVASVDIGDLIIGLPANGLHTNGYSLARKVLPKERWDQPVASGSAQTIAEALMAVHPCYLPYVRAIQESVSVKSMAHITGGGLIGNLPRALPEHLAVRLHSKRWTVPVICELLVREAHLSAEEAYRILNMGVGFCLIIAASDAQRALDAANRSLSQRPIPSGAQPNAAIIGEVEPRHQCGPSVVIVD